MAVTDMTDAVDTVEVLDSLTVVHELPAGPADGEGRLGEHLGLDSGLTQGPAIHNLVIVKFLWK